MVAATLDVVNACCHHVVWADWHVRRWMCKAALLFLTIAFSTQELATHLHNPSQ